MDWTDHEGFTKVCCNICNQPLSKSNRLYYLLGKQAETFVHTGADHHFSAAINLEPETARNCRLDPNVAFHCAHIAHLQLARVKIPDLDTTAIDRLH